MRYNSGVIPHSLVSGMQGMNKASAWLRQPIENKEGMLSCRGVDFLFQRLLLQTFKQTIPI